MPATNRCYYQIGQYDILEGYLATDSPLSTREHYRRILHPQILLAIAALHQIQGPRSRGRIAAPRLMISIIY
jgi:hypothetical protein